MFQISLKINIRVYLARHTSQFTRMTVWRNKISTENRFAEFYNL